MHVFVNVCVCVFVCSALLAYRPLSIYLLRQLPRALRIYALLVKVCPKYRLVYTSINGFVVQLSFSCCTGRAAYQKNIKKTILGLQLTLSNRLICSLTFVTEIQAQRKPTCFAANPSAYVFRQLNRSVWQSFPLVFYLNNFYVCHRCTPQNLHIKLKARVEAAQDLPIKLQTLSSWR